MIIKWLKWIKEWLRAPSNGQVLQNHATQQQGYNVVLYLRYLLLFPCNNNTSKIYIIHYLNKSKEFSYN